MRDMLRLSLIFCILTFAAVATPAFAHNADQLPFVEINKNAAAVYPVPSTSLVDFSLPQDLALTSYLPGDTITVDIIVQNLPILPEYVPQTTWTWDFGDGISSTGLSTSHTYVKPGSYIIDLHSTAAGDTPQLLDRIRINILPKAGYSLPKAVVSIDGMVPTNAYTDILTSQYGYSAQFDGSRSTGEDLQYFWDFGDTSTAATIKADHIFHPPYLYVSSLLRVTDKYGLIADNFAQLQDLDKPARKPLPKEAASQTSIKWAAFLWVTPIFVSFIAIAAHKKRRK